VKIDGAEVVGGSVSTMASGDLVGLIVGPHAGRSWGFADEVYEYRVWRRARELWSRSPTRPPVSSDLVRDEPSSSTGKVDAAATKVSAGHDEGRA
jgi:hypothetical protein